MKNPIPKLLFTLSCLCGIFWSLQDKPTTQPERHPVAQLQKGSAPEPQALPEPPTARKQRTIHLTELDCLTLAVYSESRGEYLKGKHDVAQLVLNRKRNPKFPDNICNVVFQPAQFTDIKVTQATNPQRKDPKAWQVAREVALQALQRPANKPLHTATHFYNPRLASPAWAAYEVRGFTSGNHRFMELQASKS